MTTRTPNTPPINSVSYLLWYIDASWSGEVIVDTETWTYNIGIIDDPYIMDTDRQNKDIINTDRNAN